MDELLLNNVITTPKQYYSDLTITITQTLNNIPNEFYFTPPVIYNNSLITIDYTQPKHHIHWNNLQFESKLKETHLSENQFNHLKYLVQTQYHSYCGIPSRTLRTFSDQQLAELFIKQRMDCYPIDIIPMKDAFLLTYQSGHRVKCVIENNELKNIMTMLPLYDTIVEMRIGKQFDNVCVQVYGEGRSQRVFVGYLERHNGEIVEMITEISNLFVNDVVDIACDSNVVYLRTNTNKNYSLQITTSYDRFVHDIKYASLGSELRNTMEEIVKRYGKIAYKWAFHYIAREHVTDEKPMFLRKIMMTSSFQSLVIDRFAELQNRMNEITVKYMIKEGNFVYPQDLTQPSELILDCESLLQMIDEFLSMNFSLHAVMNQKKRELQRMIPLCRIPILLKNVILPAELKQYGDWYLSSFMTGNFVDLREFLIQLLLLNEGSGLIPYIPNDVKKEILPETTLKRIQAIHLLNEFERVPYYPARVKIAEQIVEIMSQADTNHFEMANKLFFGECYLQAVQLTLLSSKEVKDHNKLMEHISLIVDCIQSTKTSPEMLRSIMKEITLNNKLKEQIMEQVVKSGNVELLFDDKSAEVYIRKYAPRYLWKLRVMEGKMYEALQEIVKFIESKQDIQDRFIEIREFIGLSGHLNEVQMNQIIKRNDLLYSQKVLFESLFDMEIEMVKQMICEDIQQTLYDEICEDRKIVQFGVLTMEELCIIANKYKLYDDLLVIYIHSNFVEEDKLKRMWEIVINVIFGNDNLMDVHDYCKRFLDKLGRFQYLVPESFWNQIRRIENELSIVENIVPN